MERKDTATLPKAKAFLTRLWLLTIIAYGAFSTTILPSFYRTTQSEFYRSKNESLLERLDSSYLHKYGMRHEEWATIKSEQEKKECLQDYKDKYSPNFVETENLIQNARARLRQEEAYWQATRFCNNQTYEGHDPELTLSNSERKRIIREAYISTWAKALSSGLTLQIIKLALFLVCSFLIVILLPIWLFCGKIYHPKSFLKDLCVPLRALRLKNKQKSP